jgi:hypothetical protein
VDSIRAIRTSGLSATSAQIVLNARIYTSLLQEPYDLIDPNVLSATVAFIGALTGDFELGGADDVRNVDLLGANGESLSGKAGYVEIDHRMYRVMTIVIPVIINDIWAQSPVAS